MSGGPDVSVGEGAQDDEDEMKEAPGAQLAHAAAPPKLYVPTAHAVQLEAPDADEYVPAAHAAQLNAPMPAKWPGTHCTQTPDESDEPVGQEAHARAVAFHRQLAAHEHAVRPATVPAT